MCIFEEQVPQVDYTKYLGTASERENKLKISYEDGSGSNKTGSQSNYVKKCILNFKTKAVISRLIVW